MQISKRQFMREGAIFLGAIVIIAALFDFLHSREGKHSSESSESVVSLQSDFLKGTYKKGSFFDTGFNDYALLFNHRPNHEIFIVSLRGEKLQSFDVPNEKDEGVHYVTKHGDDFYAVVQVRGIHKFNSNGELLWKLTIGAHHDLGFDEQGNIYAFQIAPAKCTFTKKPSECFLDTLIKISPDGNGLAKAQLSHLFEPFLTTEAVEKTAAYWQRKFERHDTFHINSLYLLPRDVPGFGEKGDFLISSRDLDVIALIDKKVERIKWSFQADELQHQHHVRLTSENLISVFNNGVERKQSEVLLIDPLKKKIVWRYGPKDKDFYTSRHGSAEELPNGNFLVSLGRKGTLFEVNRKGEVVASFELRSPTDPSVNPYRVSVIPRTEPS